MVVLDKKDYIERAQELLVQHAYRAIERDPTNKLRAKLITILSKIKRDTGMEEQLYKAMYLTGCSPQNFMVCPKSTSQAPPQVYYIKQGLSHLWGGRSPC